MKKIDNDLLAKAMVNALCEHLRRNPDAFTPDQRKRLRAPKKAVAYYRERLGDKTYNRKARMQLDIASHYAKLQGMH